MIDRVRASLKDGDGQAAVVVLETGIEAIDSAIGRAGPAAEPESADDQP